MSHNILRTHCQLYDLEKIKRSQSKMFMCQLFFPHQARERQRKEEQERLAREAAEAERKLKEEEEARERAAYEAAEKKAALARLREEKALALGAEPEKGPDVTQVIYRIPANFSHFLNIFSQQIQYFVLHGDLRVRDLLHCDCIYVIFVLGFNHGHKNDSSKTAPA